jgi:hypothetical protein
MIREVGGVILSEQPKTIAGRFENLSRLRCISGGL